MIKKLLSLMAVLFFVFACGNPVETSAAFTVSPAEAPVGSVITFDATGSDGAITSFEWNFGDGTFGNGQIVQHAYASAKKFTVTLSLRDSDGGTKTASSQADIYREGKKLILSSTRPANATGLELWIDSVYAQDSKTDTAWLSISESGFNPDYITENHLFWVSLPGSLMEYSDYALNDRVATFYQSELVLSQSPKYLFKISYCVGQFTGKIFLVKVKLTNMGSGILTLEISKGVSCYDGKKMVVITYPANIQVVLEKYYDE